MRLLVISDSHAKNVDDLPDVIKHEIPMADAVIHAGDIGDKSVYDYLKNNCKALYAVNGNNDYLNLPESLMFELDNVKIALTHGDKARGNKESWLLYQFPDANLIIYGHTHFPLMIESGLQTVVNPGSVKRSRSGANSYIIADTSNGLFKINFLKL